MPKAIMTNLDASIYYCKAVAEVRAAFKEKEKGYSQELSDLQEQLKLIYK
jgi:hypothetical protein